MLRQMMILLVAGGLLLSACTNLWNAANRTSLEADVAHVLGAGSPASPTHCAMVATTRTGFCLLDADETQVAAWSDALGLSRQTATLGDSPNLPPLASEGQVGCLDPGNFTKADGLAAYWAGARPPELALPNGGQFEYMLLLHDPETDRACVQVSYAYG